MLDSLAIKKDFIFFLKEKLGFNDNEIYINPNIVLKNKDKTLIEKFLKQKEEGVPLDYILNSSKFYEYDFYVDSRVLIPRPETEILVDYINNHFLSPIKVLDAGTGSGCIGISIALKNPNFKVYGSDYSKDALDVAFINKKNLLVKNFLPIRANWLSCFSEDCFDLIVSNPPYISEGDSHLDELIHEPNIALVSKDSGLFHIKKIIKQSSKALKNGGTLVIEHGHDQSEDVKEIFEKNYFSKIINIKDLQLIPRITIGTLER